MSIRKVNVFTNKHQFIETIDMNQERAQYFEVGHCVSANNIYSNTDIYRLGLDFDTRLFVEVA